MPEDFHWSERPGWKTFFRVGEIVVFLAIIIGLTIMLYFEFQQRERERQDRKRERIARSWTILGTIATGNSGKGEALAYLNDQNVPLTGIDLSCERMGGGWNAEERSCERPVYLQNVQLAGAYLGDAKLQGASLVNADLQGAALSGAELVNAKLQDADLWKADLRGADLSDADFSDARNLDTVDYTGAWAFEDALPIGLSGIEIDICRRGSFTSFDTPTKPSSACELRMME